MIVQIHVGFGVFFGLDDRVRKMMRKFSVITAEVSEKVPKYFKKQSKMAFTASESYVKV